MSNMKRKTNINNRMSLFTAQFKTHIFVILFLYPLCLSAQTFNDSDDLSDAVNNASGGEIFIIKNGSYKDFEATFEIEASESKPIIIKAETIGGVTLTGESQFVFKKSAYVTLEGFIFDCTGDNTLVKLEGCNNIRITRNIFELETTESIKWVYVGGVWNDNTLPFQNPSHDNRIDHNIFQNKSTPGHYITIDGTTDSNDIAYQSQNDRIDHNHFRNNSPRAVNEQESIRIGWSKMSMSSGYTIVESNLFENCDGDPEIVSVKSSDNIIRNNTFLSSYGTLSLRHGNRNRVEGNYFFGNGKEIGTSPAGSTLYTGGIRIYGKDHVIINNYLEGLNGTRWDAPITLTLGDAVDGESTNLTKHFRAENVIIAYNTLVNNSHGIEIGYDNSNKYSKDLKNIIIANNLITGSENGLVEIVESGNDQGNNIIWSNNLMYPTGTANTLVGASSTEFDTNEVLNENPFLAIDTSVTFTNTSGFWKATENTPTYNNGLNGEFVNYDFEGQNRPENSNPGADHLSTDSIRHSPITSSNVGPNAYESDDNSESLFVTSFVNFKAEGGSEDISVTSNVEWTVSTNGAWISVSETSGNNNGSFILNCTENTELKNRETTIEINGGDIARSIRITQDAAVLTNLINDGTSADQVTVTASTEQVDGITYFNYATNTLDKDLNSRWSGEGIGAEIIYNLGKLFELDLINIATLANKTYLYEIWISKDGANYTLISSVESNTTGDLEPFSIMNAAQYVKIIGKGQSSGSVWNSITEIEFYGDVVVSTNDTDIKESILVYPNPVKSNLFIKKINDNHFNSVRIYRIDGTQILEKSFDISESEISINMASYSSGSYILEISSSNDLSISKRQIIMKE